MNKFFYFYILYNFIINEKEKLFFHRNIFIYNITKDMFFYNILKIRLKK